MFALHPFLYFLIVGALSVLGIALGQLVLTLILVINPLSPQLSTLLHYSGPYLIVIGVWTATLPLSPFKKYGRVRKAIYHFSTVSLFIMIPILASSVNTNEQRLSHFKNKVGNCHPYLNSITKLNLYQESFKQIGNIFPYTYQYLYYLAEDSCRASQLKSEFVKSYPHTPKFCPKDVTSFMCLKKTYEELDATMPFGDSANIILFGLGSQLTLDESNRLEKKMPKEPTKSQASNHVKSLINLNLDLIRFAKHTRQNMYKNGKVEAILPKFPSRKIASLSPVQMKDGEDYIEEANEDEILNELLSGGFKSKTKCQGNCDALEAYILQKMGNGMAIAFDEMTKAKILTNIEALYGGINGLYASHLSQTEKKSIEMELYLHHMYFLGRH